MELLRLNKSIISRHRGERGAILPLAAIGMVVFLLAAGLSIDISHLYMVGTELQNAADAAALAAASALNSGAGGISQAVDRAVATVNKYEFDSTSVVIARGDVRFAVNLSEFDSGGTGRSEATAAADPANIRFVKVTISPKTVNMLFAKLAIGTNTVSLTRSAVAGQSVALNIFCNVVPLVPVQDDVTGAPLSVNPECPSQTVYTRGCTYTIRAEPGNQVSAGNYHILAFIYPFSSDRGGADLRRRLAIGTESCVVPNLIANTEPGVNAGPVRQGLNTRFDEYSGPVSPEEFPPDTNVKTGITYAQYISGQAAFQQAPSHPGVPLRRILILPIVNKSEFNQGRDEVHISKFAAFFMRDKVGNGNGGDLVAEYVSDRIVFGDGGYDPNGGPGNSQFTVAVLYR
jgi:Flp pilus assembly protein TadG